MIECHELMINIAQQYYAFNHVYSGNQGVAFYSVHLKEIYPFFFLLGNPSFGLWNSIFVVQIKNKSNIILCCLDIFEHGN
jgi:hypothetical protein